MRVGSFSRAGFGSLLIFVGLATLACGDRPSERNAVAGEAAVGAPVRGGTVRIGFLKEPSTFLDWNARTAADLMATDLVFRRLAEPGKEPGSFVPDLAESWSYSPDGRAIRFRLHEGVTWQDGRAVTAHDVVFTQQRNETSGLERVEAEGDHDVVFHFRRADPDILARAVVAHIYPVHILGSVSEEDLETHPFNRNPVGSGPFRLERWEAGQYLLFARRDDTSEAAGPPWLDRAVVRLFPDKPAAYREFEGGGLDFLHKVQREVFDRLLDTGRARGYRHPSREFLYVAWNTRRSPWNLTAVRRAMTALVDREALVRRFEGEGFPICEGPVPPDDPRHDPALVSPEFDPAQAEAWLLEAGLSRSEAGAWTLPDGAPFKVRLLCLSGNVLFRDVTSVVADHLRRSGIEAEVRSLELPRLLDRIDTGEFDGVFLTRPGVLPVNLSSCFGSSGDENWGNLQDGELEKLLATAETESDARRAKVAFHAACSRITELQPWTFLYYRSESIVHHPRLHGLDANPRDPVAVAEHWWIPAELQ